MFGIVADLLCAVITILFPIFASYKALRTSNPSHLVPWLEYWVVLSGILLVESWTLFIIGWFPFYSWIRLFLLSYLVLPQTQGAATLYREYVDPFLLRHEIEIEAFIGRAHERAKTLGLEHFYQVVNLIREKILGLPPVSTTGAVPRPASAETTYVQSVLSRFNVPISNLASPATGLFSMVSSTFASVTATGRSRDTLAEGQGADGSLLPAYIASASKAEQAKYIASQRERLNAMISALDREHRNLGLDGGWPDNDDLAYGTSYDDETPGLRENRSDNSFENIEHEDLPGSPSAWRRNKSGGRSVASMGAEFAQRSADEIARASGVNLGR